MKFPKYRPIVFKQLKHTVLRIIPHHSVLNSSSRRFQHALFDLFSTKQTRIKREGFHIAIQPSAGFWWVTKLYADEDGQHVEYYCSMPAEFVDAFRTKFRNHEQWRKSTLEEVPSDTFTFPEAENTDLYALKYKRHDIFSIDHDYTEQKMPCRDIVGVTSELREGEAVNVYIRTEPMKRMKWKKVADYAWEHWDKGGMPYRAGFDALRFFRDVMYGATHLIFELKSILDDIMTAIERTFFKAGDGSAKKERPKMPNPERAELLVNGDLSVQTKNKRNLPVFKTSIRYCVTSEDEVRRSMIARSVNNAYANTSERGRHDNRLEMVKVNIRAKQALNDLKNWKINDQTPNLMSVDEIGKLEQLPTSEVQQEFADTLESNQRVEIEIPRVFLDEKGVLAGTATDRGVTHNIRIPTNNPNRLFTPRAFNGSPRMGKDQAIINFIVEAYRKYKIGSVIPDFIDEQGKDKDGHWKGMANAIRDHIPEEDVIDLDFSNTAYSFYLGLQTIFRKVKDPRIAADLVSEYLSDFLLADGDGDKFQTAEFCREAAKATMGDLQDMKRIFKDQKFRQAKIKELDDILDMDVWKDYDSLSEKGGLMSGKQGQYAAPVIRRIDMLANREYSKPMFCQSNPNPAADLYKWIEQGKVVILRIKMPSGAAMPEPVKIIFGYWIVMLTFLIKLSLDGKGAGTYLVLNEPHQYLSQGLVHFLERILSEAPKYKLAPIYAFHNFSQFKKYPGFVDMLLSSSINWHIFKNTNIDEYKKLMPYLQNTFPDAQTAFESTQAFQFIAVWLDQDANYAPSFVCDALDRVADRYDTIDNSKLTELHIQKFGRKTSDVLTEIRSRNRGETSKEPETNHAEKVADDKQEKKPRKQKSAVKEAPTVEDEGQTEVKSEKTKELTLEQINALIDLALDAKDQVWFEELVKQRKKIQRRNRL